MQENQPPSTASEPRGQLRDFISGKLVRDTPEEREAVQVFARRLVEDYGYPQAAIQTHPQFRVRQRPSDSRRSFPVDIAVFSTGSRAESDLYMIVECKKTGRQDGLNQLKLYLGMSQAQIGIWFNGSDHIYLKKTHEAGGIIEYHILPSIPRFGQAIEDIGRFERKQLVPPSNLKAVFRDLRNHLAGSVTGITRDAELAQQIINILFCKIYDEIHTSPDSIVNFRVGSSEPESTVRERIEGLFSKIQRDQPHIFGSNESILLDSQSLRYVVGELQNYCIQDADRDAVGDAFEVFIGPALRGAEGQFFTPRNVVRMIIAMLDPKSTETVIDPACGSGGFLTVALSHMWQQLESSAEMNRWSPELLERQRRQVAGLRLRGVDKDSFLTRVTKAYMAIIGDGSSGIFCQNALLKLPDWDPLAQESIALGAFDAVVTNPPFGKGIRIREEGGLKQYDLARKWKRNKISSELEPTDDFRKHQAPHLLFLERCLALLKDRGRLGIVMPESILGNPSYEYVMTFLLSRYRIRAIVTLPEPLFKTSGKGGTHTKVCVLVVDKELPPKEPYSIFMSDVRWCGHDSRGNPTLSTDQEGNSVLLDEVPKVAPLYKRWKADSSSLGQEDDGSLVPPRLGFQLLSTSIRKNILVPKYYDPGVARDLAALRAGNESWSSYEARTIGELAKLGYLVVHSGVEVGKLAYGTGGIPFVRTSDLSNWEIKTDSKHCVSSEIYEDNKAKGSCKANDVLLVRDGTYLIGTSAIVTEDDLPMLLQSHILRIRVSEDHYDYVDPWLLLVLLNSPLVKRQIQANRFTQDVIDTLGSRYKEIVIPVPRLAKDRQRYSDQARKSLEERQKYRKKLRDLPLKIGLP